MTASDSNRVNLTRSSIVSGRVARIVPVSNGVVLHDPSWADIQIDEQPFQLLTQSLRYPYQFKQLSSTASGPSNEQRWIVRFFSDTGYEQLFKVALTEVEIDATTGDMSAGSEPLAQWQGGTSQSTLVIGVDGKTLTDKRAGERALGCGPFVQDREWVGLGGKTSVIFHAASIGLTDKGSTFESIVLVHCLGLAYRQLLEQVALDCRRGIATLDYQALFHLYDEALRTLAVHYYPQPLASGRGDVLRFWSLLSDALNLDPLARDARQQLDALERWIRSKGIQRQQQIERAEEKAQRVSRRRVLVFAIVVAVGWWIWISPTLGSSLLEIAIMTKDAIVASEAMTTALTWLGISDP